ncbi:putative protein OS=Ureibacillus acetophenoni OX=614649 GN=SAMN05877842_11548 PE=4 SV=1 [Ureibacillus acetophenoni]
MSKKFKKVVLALALISGFAVFTASPSEASIYEMDPGPALKPASIGIGGFTLDR